MMDEPDAVATEVERLLERAGQAAGELVRHRAQQRTQALREAARESEQRGREAQVRYQAELSAARAQVAVVDQPQWWRRAEPRQLVEAWATAQQWHEIEPEFDAVAARMRTEMIERFGLDPEAYMGEAGSDPARTLLPEPGETGLGVAARTDRGGAVAAALAQLRESRRLAAMAGQAPVSEIVRHGGPGDSPHARRSRGLGGRDQERERGR